MPDIVHFEVPAEDMERAKKFWTELLGWSIEGSKEFSDYEMIRTRTVDGSEGIGGGIMKRQHPDQQMVNYFDVDDVEKYTARVTELGGKVVMAKSPVPGMGWFAICLDSENNAFGLWQSDKGAK